MRSYFVVAILLIGLGAFGQDNIIIRNASFEQMPMKGGYNDEVINEWINCGGRYNSPPDIQPSNDPEQLFFNVNTPASDGDTYLGLVTRWDGTNESLGQKLSSKLEKNIRYSILLDLAKSYTYESRTKSNEFGTVPFTTSVSLLIWGGDEHCDMIQILAESPVIDHAEWKTYHFEFTAKDSWQYIFIEAHCEMETNKVCNGNILVDKISDIIVIE